MMRGWGVVIILGCAVAIVFAILFFGVLPHSDDAAITGLAPGQSTVFLGQTLNFPEPWKVYTPGSRGAILNLKKAGGGRAGGTFTLEDERRHPEDVHRFVDGWMSMPNNSPGFKPLGIEPFHDNSVDNARMQCVAIHWADQHKPLQLVCLASDGRWKLTLWGADSDVPVVDAFADQMPGFQRGL
ncbi:MAG TPA: hypothetical protein VGN16_22180 [Acidobacteriaceae bacterium]|jgi:hypothetical protein